MCGRVSLRSLLCYFCHSETFVFILPSYYSALPYIFGMHYVVTKESFLPLSSEKSLEVHSTFHQVPKTTIVLRPLRHHLPFHSYFVR